MFCNNCGKEIPKGSAFCPCCGTNLKNETEQVIEEKEIKENNQPQEVKDNPELIKAQEKMSEVNNQERKIVAILIFVLIILPILATLVYYGIKVFNENTDSQSNEIKNSANIYKEEKVEESKIDKDGVKALYKEKLEDKTWVKKNLYIKKDYVGNPIDESVKQKVSYSIIDNDSLEIPVGIVITDYEEGEYCTQCTILTYENEEIKIETLDTTRDYYTIDKDKNILTGRNVRMGVAKITIYTINETGAKKVGTLTSEENVENVDEEIEFSYKYYFDDKEITESKYNEIYNKYKNEDEFSELE